MLQSIMAFPLIVPIGHWQTKTGGTLAEIEQRLPKGDWQPITKFPLLVTFTLIMSGKRAINAVIHDPRHAK